VGCPTFSLSLEAFVLTDARVDGEAIAPLKAGVTYVDPLTTRLWTAPKGPAQKGLALKGNRQTSKSGLTLRHS
jgi:hypothetical protein